MRTLSTKFAAAIFALFATAGFGHAQTLEKCKVYGMTPERMGFDSEQDMQDSLVELANQMAGMASVLGWPWGETTSCVISSRGVLGLQDNKQHAMGFSYGANMLSYNPTNTINHLYCFDLNTGQKLRPGANGQCYP